MNTKQLIAAAAFALVGSTAFAEDAAMQYIDIPVAPSKLQRAEVKAEYLRAQAAGEPSISSETAVVSVPVSTSGLTRAQVRTSLAQARASGKYVFISDSPEFAQDVTGIQRTREEVRAEARAYTRASQSAADVQAGH